MTEKFKKTIKKSFLILLALSLLASLSILLANSKAFALSEIDLCVHFYSTKNYAKAIEFGLKAVNLYPTDVNAHLCLGEAYRLSGMYDKALTHIKLAEKLTTNDEDLYYIYDKLGITYSALKDYENALRYYTVVLDMSRTKKDSNKEGATLQNIGEIYRKTKQYDKALDFYFQALKVDNTTENKMYVYNNIGLTYLALKDYKNAEKYLSQACELSNKHGEYYLEATCKVNLGTLYANQKDYERAKKLLSDATQLSRQINNKHILAIAYKTLGDVYIGEKDYPKAKLYLKEAQNIYSSLGMKEEAEVVEKQFFLVDIEKQKAEQK